MLRFFILIVFFGIILYLALIFESTAFALLGFAMGMTGVFSFVMLLFLRGKVGVELSVPLRLAQKNQVFSLRIRVQNRSRIPIGGLRIVLSYGESHGMAREKRVIRVPGMGQGKAEVGRNLSMQESGYYEFSAKSIRLYDPMGIFYMRLRPANPAHAMVFPEISEIPVRLGEAVRLFWGETVSYDDFRPGNDPGETTGVREFRDGDKLQRVHWKLSARTDDLMVKEDALPMSCPVILFMPEGNVGASGSLDFMASLSFTLMDMHCGHYLVWHSEEREDLVRARVEDEESYYFAITTYLRDGSFKSGGNRLERYREKYKAEPFLHSVEVGADEMVYVDGTAGRKVRDFEGEITLN